MENKTDNNDFLKNGTRLLKKLNEDNPEVQVISNADPFYVLRTDILLFFRQIMSDVKKKETLKDELESSFLEDVKETGEEALTFQQKMSLYKLITTQSNSSAEGILSLFKPTPGAPSLLADNISKDEKEDKFSEIYDKMSSDDFQTVQSFMDSMNKMYEEVRQTREENDEV